MLRLLLRENELCEVFDDETEDNDSVTGFACTSPDNMMYINKVHAALKKKIISKPLVNMVLLIECFPLLIFLAG